MVEPKVHDRPVRRRRGAPTSVRKWEPLDAHVPRRPPPDRPEDEGVADPELAQVDVEGAHLLANEARPRLKADGFTDDQIDAWTRAYFEEGHEGDVDGLVAFIAEEQARGRTI